MNKKEPANIADGDKRKKQNSSKKPCNEIMILLVLSRAKKLTAKENHIIHILWPHIHPRTTYHNDNGDTYCPQYMLLVFFFRKSC